MLRKSLSFLAMLVVIAAGALLAVAATPEGYVTFNVALPSGDAAAGRIVFRELKCNACHAVAGEEGQSMAPPVASMVPAPLLGPDLAQKDLGEVATAVVAPSHKVSSVIAERAGGKLSPMGDFSQLLTVRQLADLLAYLRSFEQPQAK